MFRHPKKAYPKIASVEEWQRLSYSTLTVLQSSIARWALRVLSVLSRRSGSLTEDLPIWKMLAADLGRFFRPFGAEHMHTHPRIKPPHWENVFNPCLRWECEVDPWMRVVSMIRLMWRSRASVRDASSASPAPTGESPSPLARAD